MSKKQIDHCQSARRHYELEKQPPGSVQQGSCFEKFEKNSRKTSVVVFLLILLTKTLHHGYFLGNFLKYFRTVILKNISGRLLLKLRRKVVITVFFSTEAAITEAVITNLKKCAY